MLIDIKVPVFAESVSEGTLLEWQKRPGDTVTGGETLVEIETDKVVLEVPAPESGLLKEVRAQDGDTVTSEQILAVIDTEYGAVEKTHDTPPPQVMSIAQARQEGVIEDRPMSPSVRRLVAEHGLEPVRIPGTGKHGRILKSDVTAFLEGQGKPSSSAPPPAVATPSVPTTETPPPVPGRGERREPLSRIRARIAERLVQAQQSAAILTTFNEVDMRPVMDLRERYRDTFEKAHGIRLGYMSFFAKAAVLALQRFPVVNAYLEADAVVYHDYCDIGIAVASPRGLIVPVLRDVQRQGFADIERGIRQFVDRARDGRLTPQELEGGSFTITNGGIFGSLLSTPILNPPQSAILGMHKIQERPVAIGGEVVIRPMMYLALSYDHRIIDGQQAVRFLVTVKEVLEDPARLLLDV